MNTLLEYTRRFAVLWLSAAMLAACVTPARTSGDAERLTASGSPGSAKADARDAPAEFTAGRPIEAFGVIARVDGHEIPAELFNREIDIAVFRAGGALPREALEPYRSQLLEGLLYDHLLDLLADAKAVSLTEVERSDALTAFEAGVGGEEQRRRLEPFFGGLRALDEHVLRAARRVKLLREHYGAVVTDADVRVHYDGHVDRYTSGAQVRASHILLKEGGGRTDEQARAKAAEVAELARAPGADFAALAREHSQGSDAERGGDLGFFEADHMIAPISATAFALAPGEVSGPVRSELGWHVIKVSATRPGSRRPFDQVASEIRLELAEQKTLRAKALAIAEITPTVEIRLYPENIRIAPEQE